MEHESVEASTEYTDTVGEGNALNTGEVACNLRDAEETETQFSSKSDAGSAAIGPSTSEHESVEASTEYMDTVGEGNALNTGELACNLRDAEKAETQFSSKFDAGSAVIGPSTSEHESVEASTEYTDTVGEGNALNTGELACNLRDVEKIETQFSSKSDAGSAAIGPSTSGYRDGRCLTQLVIEDGKFNADEAENFTKEIKQAEVGGMVSIIGPQISGKSTLLNHLFGTNFKEMEAAQGRSATTKGAWIAKSACTPHIVMDLEGADGSQQHPEDEAALEKRLALLAIVVSDIVLINMWSHEIFAEENATKSLLRTLFPVAMKLSGTQKTTTLMFVIRDHDETEIPLKDIELKITEDVQKILPSSLKPKGGEETTNTSVEVVALPSYRYSREQFLTEVGNLRKQFFSSDTTSPVLSSNGLTTDFMERAKRKWDDINLRGDETTSQCNAIADEKRHIVKSKLGEFGTEVGEVTESLLPDQILDWGKRMRSVLDASLAEYDSEVPFIYEPVRTKKRKELESDLFKTVRPFFELFLEYMSRAALEDFETSLKGRLKKSKGSPATTESYLLYFDDRSRELASVLCESPDTDTYASTLREPLKSKIEEHVKKAKDADEKYVAKLNKVTESCKKALSKELSEYVEALLDRADKNSWSEIRKLLDDKAHELVIRLCQKVNDLDEHTKNEKLIEFKEYGGSVVEKILTDEVQLGPPVIFNRMKISLREKYWLLPLSKYFFLSQWFLLSLFLQPSKKTLDDMGRTAFSQGIEFLDFMDSICLEDTADNIELASKDALVGSSGSTVRDDAKVQAPFPSSRKLIHPGENNKLRHRFKEYAESTIREKKKRKDAEKGKTASNWKIPQLGHL